MKTVHFVSLGCPKNRVDAEVMLGVSQESGFRHVDDPSEAEVIVISTCGFIEDAKKESIDTIFEMARHKETGRCDKLVVTGCLAQRHPDELAKEIPEIDHLLGSSDMTRLRKVLDGGAERVLVGSPADWLVSAETPRVLSTRQGSAYVKIAEGCNRTCSFCVIPSLRGKQRSRAVADVVREVEALVARGVKEINLVSQDTVAYGRDRDDGAKLHELARAVADVPGVVWTRLFYLYPETLDDALIELLAQHPKVVPYVDMPLQHAADGMLRRMRRGHGGSRLYRVVERLRKAVPDLTFRTAFILGHPGETDEEFEELCTFVRWAQFDRVGFFRYSDEESCRSHGFDGKVTAKVAASRLKKLAGIQRKISQTKTKALIGKELDVLVEGPSEEHDLVMTARHAGQAPEIDGVVFLSDGEAHPGQMRRVRISQASDYDVVGELLDDGDAPEPPRTTKGPIRLRVLPSDGRAAM